MNGDYYNSQEQHFWEGPCNDADCEDCLKFHGLAAVAAHQAKLASQKDAALVVALAKFHLEAGEATSTQDEVF